MNDEINYKNNPLHGLALKKLLIELVDHYGFEILFAYLHLNCFKTNPSIESSIKFLKKTDWAREKLEAFYLYEFKHLPRASSEQFLLPPRDRIIPEDQTPGEPKELSLEDAERLREKRQKKSAARGSDSGNRNQREHKPTKRKDHDSSRSKEPGINSKVDPWANWKKPNND
ncbi:MAG: VF530 family DNA-binding protein [Agarilytica sp.]